MKILTIILTIFVCLQLTAQCPETANTSANGCLYLVWATPPNPLPTIVGYTLTGGSGTSGSPAVYQPGGGCGANKGGFTGSFTLANGTVCTYNAGMLPVRFHSFSAKLSEGQGIISFITVSEINNDFFDIERSLDGIVFTSIGTMAGAGNSQEPLAYTWKDRTPMKGTNYYRIKQTDFDGHSVVSDVVSFYYGDGKNSFEIRTTIISDQLQIQSSVIDFDIKIMNVDGNIISIHANLDQDQNIDISNYPTGVYFVSFSKGKEVQTYKILKI